MKPSKIRTYFLISALLGVGLLSGVYALQQRNLENLSSVSSQQTLESQTSISGLTAEQISLSQTVQAQIVSQELQQNSQNLDQLYQEAAIADLELQKIANELATLTEGTVVLPPRGLKGRKRAEEKIQLEYNNDASRITDLARLSIEYETLKQLYEALKFSPESFEIVRIKDRFIKPTPGGYRDILLNVKLSNQHIAEVQLTLKSINEVRFGEGFKLYQQVRQILNLAQLENRELTTTELQKIDELNDRSQKLYDAALLAQPANDIKQ